jgi:hypothetical protein
MGFILRSKWLDESNPVAAGVCCLLLSQGLMFGIFDNATDKSMMQALQDTHRRPLATAVHLHLYGVHANSSLDIASSGLSI